MITNNTDGAALLPVTADDRELAAAIRVALYRTMPDMPSYPAHLVAETIAAFRQSHSLPGDGMREALAAICAAQKVEPYRGWNLTELNAATDRARELLGLPSIRDLNPDIAAMQDKVAANRDSLLSLLGRAALTPSPLPATQEDAERSGAEVDVEARRIARAVCERRALKRDNGLVYGAAFEAAKEALYTPAMSDLQRQEYDGEAVREALEPFACDDFETPITDEQGWTEFGLSWSKDRIRDWFGPSAFRRAREVYRAALAHPAQARDEMLSGEPVQKLHELPRSNFTLHRATPAGHRPCRHCDGKDDHCSVCEGVGYLPSHKGAE